MLTPNVAHLGFVRDDDQPLDFLPGQFIQVHFQHADGSAAKRSYSLANVLTHSPGSDDVIEIAVSFVPGGAATAMFEALEPGQRLMASGPYGRFCLSPQDRNLRYLLVATGTGVTPYRAMLPRLAAVIAERDVEVVLLQGARTRGELLYRDEFLAFAGKQPRFRYLQCLSREQPEGSRSDLRHGYVQQHLAQCAPDPEQDIAYLCGNPDMVDACHQLLQQAGLTGARIRREKYVSNK